MCSFLFRTSFSAVPQSMSSFSMMSLSAQIPSSSFFSSNMSRIRARSCRIPSLEIRFSFHNNFSWVTQKREKPKKKTLEKNNRVYRCPRQFAADGSKCWARHGAEQMFFNPHCFVKCRSTSMEMSTEAISKLWNSPLTLFEWRWRHQCDWRRQNGQQLVRSQCCTTW